MGERTRVFNAFEVCCGNGSLDSLQTKSLYMGGVFVHLLSSVNIMATWCTLANQLLLFQRFDLFLKQACSFA